MSKNYHIIINIINPRNGRKYKRGDNMIERYTININEAIYVDTSLSFCIGKSQTERTVKYNFGTDHHVNREELLNAVIDITNKYQPYNRTTALISPENYNKVLININGNEYVLERNNTEVSNLINAIDYHFLRTMLAKEKLYYLKYGTHNESDAQNSINTKEDSLFTLLRKHFKAR